MTQSVVNAASRVTFHFSLSLTNGDIVDSNFDAQPATCVIGDGSMLPAFDQCLVGMTVGERRQFTIAAVDAFGVRQDANLKRVARDKFPADVELVPGLVMSFQAEGGELPGVIHRLMGDVIEIDFNHPLAGKDIVFDVHVLAAEAVY